MDEDDQMTAFEDLLGGDSDEDEEQAVAGTSAVAAAAGGGGVSEPADVSAAAADRPAADAAAPADVDTAPTTEPTTAAAAETTGAAAGGEDAGPVAIHSITEGVVADVKDGDDDAGDDVGDGDGRPRKRKKLVKKKKKKAKKRSDDDDDDDDDDDHCVSGDQSDSDADAEADAEKRRAAELEEAEERKRHEAEQRRIKQEKREERARKEEEALRVPEHVVTTVSETPADKDKDVYFCRLPAFVGLDVRMFDEQTEERLKQEAEREGGHTGPMTTIRWRPAPGGDEDAAAQSNSRFVEWSDGSWTLHVGKHAFPMSKEKEPVDARYLFSTEVASGLDGATGEVRASHGSLRQKMVVRPSDNKLYKKFTGAQLARSQKKTAAIKRYKIEKDPEEQKKTMADIEQFKIERRLLGDSAEMPSSQSAGAYSDSDLDAEEGDIGAIKKKYGRHTKRRREKMEQSKRRASRRAYDSDEDEREDRLNAIKN